MNKCMPFSAIVGQEKAKKALIYSAINPKIGGVLLAGQKGTAKSTLVRSFGQLLPTQTMIKLPINITLDMLIGTLDVGATVLDGQKKILLGLLKKAHHNVLYIDEINLLSQNIVCSLVDSWASGMTRVEREGFSETYASKFSVIGTMNPEEGGVTAELLDQFGLYVEIKGLNDVASRKAVIKRHLEYEKNPSAFIEKYQQQDISLVEKIINAQAIINQVTVNEPEYDFVVDICKQANVLGHRADIYLVQTAMAITAYNGDFEVTKDAIAEAAHYVLPHRMREQLEANETNECQDSGENGKNELEQQSEERTHDQLNHSQNEESKDKSESYINNGMEEEKTGFANIIYSIDFMDDLKKDRKKRIGAGRRSKSLSGSSKGRYIGFKMPSKELSDIAFDATIRAAAVHQKSREAEDGRFIIKQSDIRIKKRECKVGRTIIFAVDASGSMGARNRISATKNAILSILYNAYQKRDKVAMIAFRKNQAEIVLPITKSKDLAYKKLQKITTGGRTPLSLGIDKARQMIMAEMAKDKDMLPLFILITDGKANVAYNNVEPIKDAMMAAEQVKRAGIDSIVIDTENDYISLGLAKDIAEVMDSEYYKMDEIKGNNIIDIIDNRRCG